MDNITFIYNNFDCNFKYYFKFLLSAERRAQRKNMSITRIVLAAIGMCRYRLYNVPCLFQLLFKA